MSSTRLGWLASVLLMAVAIDQARPASAQPAEDPVGSVLGKL
jgi:hypothetical protein